MRFLLYNIAYGTGSPGGEYRRLLQSHRYLKTPQRIFDRIVNFIDARKVDVAALIEADCGSLRTRGVSQIEVLSERLGSEHAGANKYAPESLWARLPYFRHQANAFIGNGVVLEESEEWFFSCGTKKRILCANYDGIRLILVHLALKKNVRARQIAELRHLIDEESPTILAGDFNTFGGAGELQELVRSRRWQSANAEHLGTYPAWKPHHELDYILYSPGLTLTGFHRPTIQFSDHLPLVADFELA